MASNAAFVPETFSHQPLLPSGHATKRLRVRRWMVAVGIGLGIMECYALRSVLSVAIVGLRSRFNWTSSEKGAVLSSFFWGYVAAMLFAPKLVARCGRARTLACSVTSAAALTAGIPLAARQSVAAMCFLRAMTGAAEAATYPSVLALLERWAPDLEPGVKTTRGRFVSIALGGDTAGTVLGFLVAGIGLRADGSQSVAMRALHLGWEAPFIIVAAFSLPWLLAWCSVAADSPTLVETGKPALGIPWHHIIYLRNPAVYALFIQHLASNWCSYTLLTELPSFLTDRFDVSLERTATLLIPVYVAYACGQQSGGQLVDYAVNVYRYRLVTARLALEWVSFGGSAVALFAVGYADSTTLVILLVSIATYCLGLSLSGGWCSNFLDLAPARASGLYTFSNFVANLVCAPCTFSSTLYFNTLQQPSSHCAQAGIATPLVTEALVTSPGSWMSAFGLVAFINIFAVTIWTFTISTEPLVV